MTRPYEVHMSSPSPGGSIGWVDREGVLHVEPVDASSGPDPAEVVKKAIDEALAALDEAGVLPR